jgi:hypothetical protein
VAAAERGSKVLNLLALLVRQYEYCLAGWRGAAGGMKGGCGCAHVATTERLAVLALRVQ